MPDVLRVERVTYRYAGSEAAALDDVSLSLAEGELTVLAGVSGSGKSTLMRAACGLVPHFFGGEIAGRVEACGRDTRTHGPAGVADVVAMVFQDPESQVVMNGVRAELELSLETRGHGGAGAARAVEEAALALGIQDLLDRQVHTLSGGELQRVALAAALVAGPRLLLLDEPTSQLDPVAGEELVSQLRRLNEEWGTTVLIGEHRLERCLAAADRVIVLDRGRVACDDSPAAFLRWAARAQPDLLPPAARMFSLAGIGPLPATVKDARSGLGERAPASPARAPAAPRRPRLRRGRRGDPRTALRMTDVWVEWDDGSRSPTVALRGLSFEAGAGETVALMGRNGAGKSTLLRVAAGVACAERGDVRAAGEVALLLQTPADYLLHERVADELPGAVADAALRELGLAGLAERDPRDMSGGARQRLALGIVLAGRGIGGGEPPAVVALDEPTRGMDPARKRELAERVRAPRGRRGRGAGRDPRRRVRGAGVSALRAARARSGGRRRPDAGGPLGRALLHDRDRARARPRRGRGAPRGGGGAAPRGRRDGRLPRCGRRTAGKRGERVSWQGGSALVVVLAATAGVLWFERGRPDAKLVALVAALAALAVAARVLFAAVPNVQGTTDVALLSGYVLGPAPGLMVGALGALASNLFLGQGPWTPWQMVGWGAAGLFGAGLARLWGRQLGRRSLALACGLAGLAFGAWMDLFTLTSFAAQTSAGGYVAIATLSLPFNVAHAIGNVALCLVFGPSFVRVLERFSRRLQVRWVPLAPRRAPGAATLTTLLVAAAALAALAPAAGASTGEVRDGLRYLERAQNRDGGFGGAPGEASSQLVSGWAALGLEAAGRHPLDVRRAGRTPLDFIRAGVGSLSETGELERTILAVRGAGLDPRRFGGRDLIADLERKRRPDGSFSGLANWTAFGIMALRASGRSPGSAAVRRAGAWLAAQQNDDGGFAFATRAGGSFVDETGAALQGLAAARRGGAVVRRALSYLRRAQNADGGFGQTSGYKSNAQSTAWAVQGIVAGGGRPASFRKGGRSPLRYLATLQQDDGSFRYSRSSAQTPVWVTAQVITALRRKAFPVEEPPRRRRAKRRAAAVAAKPVARERDRPEPVHAAAAPRRPRRGAAEAAPPAVAARSVAARAPEDEGGVPAAVPIGAGIAALGGGAAYVLRRRRPAG